LHLAIARWRRRSRTGSPLCKVRPRDGFAIAQRNQAFKPEVDADALRTRTICGFDLNVEDDIQLASLAGQDCRSGLPGCSRQPL
jgi:hypothetical protein